MATNYDNELITIKALDLLFYNYTDEMLSEMLANREFSHVWDKYIDLDKLTHMQIWEGFLYKMSYEAKSYLISVALKHWGDEAKQNYHQTMMFRKMAKDSIQ